MLWDCIWVRQQTVKRNKMCHCQNSLLVAFPSKFIVSAVEFSVCRNKHFPFYFNFLFKVSSGDAKEPGKGHCLQRLCAVSASPWLNFSLDRVGLCLLCGIGAECKHFCFLFVSILPVALSIALTELQRLRFPSF